MKFLVKTHKDYKISAKNSEGLRGGHCDFNGTPRQPTAVLYCDKVIFLFFMFRRETF